jgi:hypothetical protein
MCQNSRLPIDSNSVCYTASSTQKFPAAKGFKNVLQKSSSPYLWKNPVSGTPDFMLIE